MMKCKKSKEENDEEGFLRWRRNNLGEITCGGGWLF